ncbi:MAG TPA: ABC transporter permease, partial [Xanthomonadales bacterium]|nr:ABC transporter permease [Xanthomonadales bacterium]
MFWQELRHAARQLLKRPGYALLSVLVLAGGLGSTLFMLSAIDAFILKPLPFPHADRLVHIGAHEAGDDDYEGISARDFAQIGAQKPQGLEVLAAYGSGTINVADDGGPERYDGAFVTHDLFPLIGEQPVLGRAFTAEDDEPGAPTVALLSDRVWRDRYHADPGVIGKTIRINAQPATIIGVMPPKFAFPFRENVWIPLRADPAQKRADAFWVEMIGRV